MYLVYSVSSRAYKTFCGQYDFPNNLYILFSRSLKNYLFKSEIVLFRCTFFGLFATAAKKLSDLNLKIHKRSVNNVYKILI